MKYTVTVNGKKYEVEVENAESEAAATVTTAAPVKKAAEPVPSGGKENVCSPMPGTINDIKVASGQAVKRGDVLLILEAMKMENEILADCDGTIGSIAVSKGDSVNSGQLLMTIC